MDNMFDSGKIKYTDDYQDVIMNRPAKPVFPEWKVYFDGSFWGHHGRDHAGNEIQINQTFDWAGYRWIIPAIYSCGQGLVIDFCMQVSAESIRRFMEKWNLNPDHDSCDCFTPEQQMQLELENPLCLHFSPDIQVNGKNFPVPTAVLSALIPVFQAKSTRSQRQNGSLTTMDWIRPLAG